MLTLSQRINKNNIPTGSCNHEIFVKIFPLTVLYYYYYYYYYIVLKCEQLFKDTLKQYILYFMEPRYCLQTVSYITITDKRLANDCNNCVIAVHHMPKYHINAELAMIMYVSLGLVGCTYE